MYRYIDRGVGELVSEYNQGKVGCAVWYTRCLHAHRFSTSRFLLWLFYLWQSIIQPRPGSECIAMHVLPVWHTYLSLSLFLSLSSSYYSLYHIQVLWCTCTSILSVGPALHPEPTRGTKNNQTEEKTIQRKRKASTDLPEIDHVPSLTLYFNFRSTIDAFSFCTIYGSNTSGEFIYEKANWKLTLLHFMAVFCLQNKTYKLMCYICKSLFLFQLIESKVLRIYNRRKLITRTQVPNPE